MVLGGWAFSHGRGTPVEYIEPLELGGLCDDVEADVLLAAHHFHGDPPPHLQAEQGVHLA